MKPDAIEGARRVPHGGCTDPGITDFSANINPRIPSGIAGVYEGALMQSKRYPADDYPEYRTVAGEYVGCPPEDIVPTPGGLAGIRLALATSVSCDDSVLVPAPSFGEYAREVELQGGVVERVPHDEILRTDPSDHAMAIVCNPNNPTGTVYESGDLLDFLARCRHADTTLLVDEAFLGFTDRPSMAGQRGAIVARSLTKLFGLPGLRAGFLVASGAPGERLKNARRTWNLSTPAVAVGAHCMAQREFVTETRERVRTERERLVAALDGEYDVSPSEAPFLLLETGERAVDRVIERVALEDMTVRDARTFRGLDSHVRVAIRTPEENDRLLDALLDV
ncbi:aminotransferase class I/II-fold pyridoxal phosphate-dependent enzyme [Halalkalicoccus jeotgali]|uniref:Aminotransferase n=1 Tax=Halalkalicoccus jeotgali (strain DSM 18796 / CECT 7217 / JCM 14584 / KCTC 4019 / B3) TaxID=795797 RepID=D8J6Y7_HALJB|nr:aminotransferase class I/II-fold pyridoxal phosphate-dependent enzyme [Halalkalicoccus jeotgali]ADJ15940.1 L-threonine-O-3-phosphate decarboxylase [Halalkalicoccus jeotgali B3]ELY38036.1 L-threonine-O-3-phosphate decarboxylase [Halalkalicoccus jeotgali B3]